MESSLLLEVVTPDRSVVKSEADYVGIPGVEGQFGVLPRHIPLLSALAVGKLYFRHKERTENVFISNGFAEVAHDRVTVLAESAECAQDIDTERALAAKRRAEERLAGKQDDLDVIRAQAALARAVGRLNVAGML